MVIKTKGDRSKNRSKGDLLHEHSIGFYAYVLQVAADCDLDAECAHIDGFVSETECLSYKSAVDLANLWNAFYRQGNSYLFDEPKF